MPNDLAAIAAPARRRSTGLHVFWSDIVPAEFLHALEPCVALRELLVVNCLSDEHNGCWQRASSPDAARHADAAGLDPA